MTRLGGAGEAAILRGLLPHLARAGGDLVIGAGEDDTAAWRAATGGYTVATCDTFVEGVHFELAWLDPATVGWRAIALTLGDLAAKGADPTYALVAASLPPHWEVEALEAVYGGMAELAGEVGLKIVGGDTTRTSGPATFTVMALGSTPGPVVPRSAARPGWLLGVTGRLGAAEAGLVAAMRGETLLPAWETALRRPRPRLAEGRTLARSGLCCGDISDGLIAELRKFRDSAGAGSRLRWDAVPRAEGVSDIAAVAGGEEVELVCAGPEEAFAAALSLDCGLTVVGEFTAEGDVVVVDSSGHPLDLPAGGYDHFA